MRFLIAFLFIFFSSETIVKASPPYYYKRYYRTYKYKKYRYYPYKNPYYHPRRFINPDPRIGVYLGFGVLTDYNIKSDNALTQIMHQGYGMNLFIGVRFSQSASVEFSYNSAWMKSNVPTDKTGVLYGICFDAKIFLAPKSLRFEPYLQVGAGLYNYKKDSLPYYEFGNELSGVGFHLGAGIDLWFTPHFVFGVKALYKGIQLDNQDAVFYDRPESAFFSQFVGEANFTIKF